ncbi:primosomal protein N' [Helicobacter muridarum]|uniref:Replication restart protein PriA n=1 Tax=Helicobacter muridarum TaxID=216 RepID=A0A099U074_9HELI|nr:primosomal protein N' [Helicobacter muridarum]TLE00348.1 primosomal protein N' [Helicobacter muridarum]STQ85852.1 primosome assembly protein PriA [Helicobacter muridarum]
MSVFLLIEVEIIGAKLFPLTYKIDISNLDSKPKLYDLFQVELGKQNKLAIMTGIAKHQDENKYTFKIKEASKSDKSLSEIQKTLLSFISNYYMQQIGISAQIFTPFISSPQELNKLIDISPNLNILSQKQQEVLQFCQERYISLIFGATGSGKTEIYLHIINDVISNNKQVLFLMPEISLTPQIQKRLEIAFPNLIGMWHSKQTAKQKTGILQKLISGKIRIIAGARSALFLPYQNLGAIIVDEEHDDSYKSTSQPKYNAKDLAILLSTKNILVVLGSATPSVKSYYLAKQNNYLIRLESAFHKASNMLIFDSITVDSPISQIILQNIIEVLNKKLQVIIFVPIRANFKSLLCRNCKQKIMCPSCSITLSLHQKKHALICHYCNFTRNIPAICEYCGCSELEGLKLGTEEIKNHLEGALKDKGIDANIEIFDRDNITTQRKLEKILNDFNDKKIDILIGTQMLAKGHDYHNIALSIILGLDYMLAMQDYRAIERTFSLLYQVGGRSGRKQDGKIIVQTSNKELILDFWGDYKLVIDYELQSREFMYPPFTRLGLVNFANKNEYKAKNLAIRFSQLLEKAQLIINKEFEVIGVCEGNTAKIKNKFYYQVLLRAKTPFVLQQVIRQAKQMADNEILDSIDIDIDPLQI